MPISDSHAFRPGWGLERKPEPFGVPTSVPFVPVGTTQCKIDYHANLAPPPPPPGKPKQKCPYLEFLLLRRAFTRAQFIELDQICGVDVVLAGGHVLHHLEELFAAELLDVNAIVHSGVLLKNLCQGLKVKKKWKMLSFSFLLLGKFSIVLDYLYSPNNSYIFRLKKPTIFPTQKSVLDSGTVTNLDFFAPH